MSLPFFSIIIPCFNNEETLRHSLDSIISQTFLNWQCILVDDGSTDLTQEIARSYTVIDSRFSFHGRTFQSKGANSCRNIGMILSEAPYLIFMDADDIFFPYALQNRYEEIAGDKAFGMFIFKTAMQKPGDNDLYAFASPKQQTLDIICQFVRHEIPWHTMSVTWEKHFIKEIGGWNEKYPRLQDVELCIRALLRSPQIRFSNAAPDSCYHIGPLGRLKSQNALTGMQLLLDDYYEATLEQFEEDDDTDKLALAFSTLIYKTVNLYEHHFNTYSYPITTWENDYLASIRRAELAEEDQAEVAKLFSRLNQEKLSYVESLDLPRNWEIENELLSYIRKTLSDGKSILELGSGTGTAKLLCNYNVISIEHNADFAARRSPNHLCLYAPLENGWYELPVVIQALNMHFDLLLVDGPPQEKRTLILHHLDLFRTLSIPVIFDDINREADAKTMYTFCEELGYEYTILEGDKKHFAICRKKT